MQVKLLKRGRPLDAKPKGRTPIRSIPIPDDDWKIIQGVARQRGMYATELVRLGAIRECERTPDDNGTVATAGPSPSKSQ